MQLIAADIEQFQARAGAAAERAEQLYRTTARHAALVNAQHLEDGIGHEGGCERACSSVANRVSAQGEVGHGGVAHEGGGEGGGACGAYAIVLNLKHSNPATAALQRVGEMLGARTLYVVAVHAQAAYAAVVPKKLGKKESAVLDVAPVEGQQAQATELPQVVSDELRISVVHAEAIHLNGGGHDLSS
jgi:hypothetical protein